MTCLPRFAVDRPLSLRYTMHNLSSQSVTAAEEAFVAPLGVVSLANSLQPLQMHMDGNKERLRFLAVVSPT